MVGFLTCCLLICQIVLKIQISLLKKQYLLIGSLTENLEMSIKFTYGQRWVTLIV